MSMRILIGCAEASLVHAFWRASTNQSDLCSVTSSVIFFGTNGINTRETAVLTENRILSCFLSQFNVLSPRFAVQLFSPSLLLLSLAVSCTKGKKKLKKTKMFPLLEAIVFESR